MGKVITFKNQARAKVLEGMIEAKKAVTSTLGPKGHTVMLDNGTIHPVITKDGDTVLEFIDFTDPYKNLGVSSVKDVVHTVNGECGDGSTTTTLLSVELCEAGNELIERDFDAVDIKKGFQKAANDVISALEKNKKLIESEEDILKVATISANNDSEIGGIIKDAFVGVGEDGVVVIEAAKNRKGETKVTYSPAFYVFNELRNEIFRICRRNDYQVFCGHLENWLYFTQVFKFFTIYKKYWIFISDSIVVRVYTAR